MPADPIVGLGIVLAAMVVVFVGAGLVASAHLTALYWLRDRASRRLNRATTMANERIREAESLEAVNDAVDRMVDAADAWARAIDRLKAARQFWRVDR